ncbi:MAG: HAD family phosphatase [Bowdeniella nasicola]|nr:HAD family phosphatase [Bowdeniella nasicola]
MTKPTLTAIMFDIGQVVVSWDPVAALEPRYGRIEAERLLSEADFARRNPIHDAGLPFAHSIDELRTAGRAEAAEALAYYVENFEHSLTGLIEGTTELIRELGERGIGVYGLTNWSAETFGHARHAAPVLDEFDGILVSGQEGLAKPDPEIFTLALTRFGLDAERTGFVDDSPRNVEAAAALGLATHQFTDARGARSWALAAIDQEETCA